ncbi:MAG: hypothetical protein PHS53_04340 [Candidatus Pacebacteria bacterium]|nr:hypothetical protein [Candidatus Paceibacterota bacterium]MDD5357348.1 hypothetical protein [Candidatus Paceibacterota bacterium]
MKATSIIIGVIAVLVIGGLIYVGSQNTSTTPLNGSPTPLTTSTESPVSNQPGNPAVTTSTTVFPTDTTAIVTGTVVPNGSFTSFWFEYGLTSNLGNKTTNQVLGSGYVAITAPNYITGLTKDTTYYYRLVAQNEFGTVTGTTYSFQTTHGNPPPVGSAPGTKTLVATGISRNTANLNGEVTPNRASTQYWFEYGKTANLGNTSAFVNAGDGTAKVSASISLTDLLPLTTYYFRINAQNQFGTVNGAIVNFKTLGPASPSEPTATTRAATGVTSSRATLQGTVNPSGLDTTYWFEYSTDSLLGSVLIQTTDSATITAGTNAVPVTADISGLPGATTYYFRIAAQNSEGTVRGDRMTFKTK